MAGQTAAQSFDKGAAKVDDHAAELAHPHRAVGPYAEVMALQHMAGNGAVTALLQGSGAPADAGQPLDAATRAEMEQRFGHDFSQVRVHTDTPAANAAAGVSAKAYTIGSDLVFGEGRYAPETHEGQRLLAHELAHVVQQSRGGAAPSLDPGSSLEQAAETAASQATAGSGPVAVAGASGVGVARAPDDELPFYQRLNRVYQRALDLAPKPVKEQIEQANAAAQQFAATHGISEREIDKAVQVAEPVLQQAEATLGIQPDKPKADAQQPALPTVWLGQPPLDVRLQQRKQAQQDKDTSAKEDPSLLPPPPPQAGANSAGNAIDLSTYKPDPPPTDFEKKLQSKQKFAHQVTIPSKTIAPINWVGRPPSPATVQNLALYQDDEPMPNTYISKDNYLKTRAATVNVGLISDSDVMPVRDPKTGELKGYRLRQGETIWELDRDGNIVTTRGLEAPLESPVVDPIDVAFIVADVGPLVAKGVMAGGKALIRGGAKGLLRETTEVGSESIAKSATKMQSKVGQEAIDLALEGSKPPSSVLGENLPPIKGSGGRAANDVLPDNVVPFNRPQVALNAGDAYEPLAQAEGFAQGGVTSSNKPPVGMRPQAIRGGQGGSGGGDVVPPRRGASGSSGNVTSLPPGRGQSTGPSVRTAANPAPTAIDPKIQAQALKDVAKKASASRKVVPIHGSAEDYAESLTRRGGIPQMGKFERVIPGQLPPGSGMPPRAGKDLWGFRNGNPVGIEIKNYGKDLTSVKGRPMLEGTKQISPTGDKMDWLTWVKSNPTQAQRLVDQGVLDPKWLDIGEGGYVRRNAANHFLRPGNRYAIVISPGGQAGIAPRVLEDIKLPTDAVIRLAVPE